MYRRRTRQSPHTTIPEAVRYLASVCDGAIKRDGHGFRSDHVAYGHWLAQLPDAEWGTEEHRHARSIVRVYREQLRRAGFDPEQILGKRRPSRVKRRQVERLQTGWRPTETATLPSDGGMASGGPQASTEE